MDPKTPGKHYRQRPPQQVHHTVGPNDAETEKRASQIWKSKDVTCLNPNSVEELHDKSLRSQFYQFLECL